MEKLLVSACLLGTPCRYDGKSKPNYDVIALNKKYQLIPICPEVDGGLPTPRIPTEIKGGRAIRKDGIDVTREYVKGSELALQIAKENGISIAILKAKSPSCGCGQIYDGTHTRSLINGNGICAELLLKNGIKIINENETDKLGKI